MSNSNDTMVSQLLTLSRSTIPNQRIAAIEALGNAGGEKAVDRLLTLSRSTIPNQRIAAIEALSKAKNFK